MFSREDGLNVLEQLKALDAQREKVLEAARSAALQRAQDALRELSDLGMHYDLVQQPVPLPPKVQRTESSEKKASLRFDQTLYGS